MYWLLGILLGYYLATRKKTGDTHENQPEHTSKSNSR